MSASPPPLLRRALRALGHLAICCALLAGGAAWADGAGKLTVYFFDVGQGDGALIVTPSGKTVLVDAGPPEAGPHLASRLREVVKGKVDLAILSHPHLDHLGGMIAALQAVGAKRFMDPGFDHSSKSYRDLLEWVGQNVGQVLNPIPDPNKPQDLVTIGLGDGIVLHVMWPRKPVDPFLTGTRSDPNSNSIVFKLVYGTTAFLFVGDAEPDTEGYLIQQQLDFTSTVLKVGHHGGRHSSTEAFLAKVKPKIAVIQCGTGNDYGHPTQAAMDRLRAVGADIWRNDLEGEVKAVSDGTTVTLKAEKPIPEHARGAEVTGVTQPRVALGPIVPAERKLSASSLEDQHRYGRGGPPVEQAAHARPKAEKVEVAKAQPVAPPDPDRLIPQEVKDRYAAPAKGASGQVRYVASRKSAVFHMADCGAVKTIKAQNRLAFMSRAEAAKARKPAGDCNP